MSTLGGAMPDSLTTSSGDPQLISPATLQKSERLLNKAIQAAEVAKDPAHLRLVAAYLADSRALGENRVNAKCFVDMRAVKDFFGKKGIQETDYVVISRHKGTVMCMT